jgi:gamma-glutamyltranspeptidase/glutathione hydrolase
MRQASLGLGAVMAAPHVIMAQPLKVRGAVIGESYGARAGEQILADGGNAVDAAVGAALVSCVVSIHNCGLGGYGGHMLIGLNKARRLTAIDFNTTAPAAAREGMFAPDPSGKVPDRKNENGWLAAGVPGTIAGLDLALRRYGTKSFLDVATPAIKLAETGFPIGAGVAAALGRTAELLKRDSGATRLLFKDDQPLREGDHFRNPALAKTLQALAEYGPTAEFYRGSVASVIADAFKRNDGLVTSDDLYAYAAKEVRPLEMSWRDSKIYTAPLTAGGLTILEALSILEALDWHELPGGPQRTLLRIEALREAWRDRLTLLGDPDKAKVPVRRLLSNGYAKDKADSVKARVAQGKILAFAPEPVSHDGTVHLSVADSEGNLVALTFTHGNAFGARVVVEELGLLLGHGMSRFEPKPGHPNSPGPRKRPLHNMCPTIVTNKGLPVLAIGGAGGRKIPNSIFDVLTEHLLLGAPLEKAIATPRLHTEGDATLLMEQKWPEDQTAFLKKSGYTVAAGSGAVISAVRRDPRTGEAHAMSR